MPKSARRTAPAHKAQRVVKRKKPPARPGRTDWERVDEITDEEIERSVAGDPNAAPIMTDETLERARWVQPPKKTPISFRVDPDILDYFKSKGPGYQSRMNAALRAIMEYERRRDRSR